MYVHVRERPETLIERQTGTWRGEERRVGALNRYIVIFLCIAYGDACYFWQGLIILPSILNDMQHNMYSKNYSLHVGGVCTRVDVYILTFHMLCFTR